MNKYNKIHEFLLMKSKKFSALHSLIKSNGVLSIERDEISFFEFLVKTIISQQISSKAANSIWKKIVVQSKKLNVEINELFRRKNSEEILTKIGISARKLEYLKYINKEIYSGNLREKDLKNLGIKNLKKILKSYKGIGDWTCHMLGIFYFGQTNIWPKSDLIINKFIKTLNNDNHNLIDLEKEFSPYLSILAIHVWKHFD